MSHPATRSHDRELASAFDDQADRFERAPVQSDPDALARLVSAADLSPNALVLDSGCGPGLVAEALLEAGHRVVGVDLSHEMIDRARRRCERFGGNATFLLGSIHDPELSRFAPFDASVSRYVLHHIQDPLLFVVRQATLLRPGGVLVLSDHTTDPDPEARSWHQQVERLRDRTHTSNATPGELADLLTAAGLESVRMMEETFTLDFDEWFDRGSPQAPKDDVRGLVLSGPLAHGFRPQLRSDHRISIECWRATARGIKTGR
ncbi:class I SAM-dependent methyltransferase [Tautonia plasticadhaerens]|uniref:Putative methyltransferase YcgJ n=1 Tax=Tautonia plasticadhaerens TaxID=2527974 RepID=A0A518H5M4_9BACT|nr:class I SAM-dependent methyltransferase [Tautonia plasticadhaerens]QDV36132.1 putative methyltransferase YcgJ [Tautonia plasticadhaerens]